MTEKERYPVTLGASTTPGPLALVGSGEYLRVMAPMEAALLRGRPPRYVQLATAAVPDGPDVVAKWHRMGRAQAEYLGVEPIILAVATREEANDAAIAAQVAGAGLIYLSGGHPTFLADTLRDTLVWEAIVREWRAGAALAGCSAGAMVMGSWVPSIRHPRGGGTEGLKLVDNLRVIPHFDAFFSKVPDVVTRFMAGGASPSRLLGIDEETALVGGPGHWVVEGRGAVWLLSADEPRRFDAGSEVPLD